MKCTKLKEVLGNIFLLKLSFLEPLFTFYIVHTGRTFLVKFIFLISYDKHMA